jgi:hypothetical protein
MISLYSQFGFNQSYFDDNKPEKIRLLIDPSNSFLLFQNLINEKKNYDKLILIHGCEPPLINDIKTSIISVNHLFDKIYTFDDEIINKCSNSELFVFGSSWIMTDKYGNTCYKKKDYHNNYTMNKKYKLSFVKSKKNSLPGHKLRHQIIDVITKKRNFEFLFPEFVPIENKKILFDDSMFHLTIENSQYKNYLTEKIIDCFMSFTIPIYWGCPNIGDYFNTDGIILFKDKDDLNNILNNLSENDYEKRKKAMIENYRIAYENFAFFYDRINKMTQI